MANIHIENGNRYEERCIEWYYIGGGEHIESFTQNIFSITFEMQFV